MSAPSGELESTAISYTGRRVDHWVERLRALIFSGSVCQDWDKQRKSQHLRAIGIWTNLKNLLYTEDVEATQFREQIVQQAYECVVSADVHDLLRMSFQDMTGTKLWHILKHIARPIMDCHMIWHIASQYPQFRDVRITPVTSTPKTGISLEYQIGISEAWARLDRAPPPGSELETVAVFGEKFKKDCAASYSLHAEIQLFRHYEDGPEFTPTLPYFGCSKKACLLCETFLRALPEPIDTRGRHGICYPAWGSPPLRSVGTETAFKKLEKMLVSRIKSLLSCSIPGRRAYFRPLVPQSTLVSDFSTSTSQDLMQKKERVESATKAWMARREERLIL